jgi:hypothetical protein
MMRGRWLWSTAVETLAVSRRKEEDGDVLQPPPRELLAAAAVNGDDVDTLMVENGLKEDIVQHCLDVLFGSGVSGNLVLLMRPSCLSGMRKCWLQTSSAIQADTQ